MKKWECPRCTKAHGFKRIGGKRPGWECQACGIFYPADTWEPSPGGTTLVRKYPTKPKRRGYIDADALKNVRTSVNGLREDVDDSDYMDRLDIEKELRSLGIEDLDEFKKIG